MSLCECTAKSHYWPDNPIAPMCNNPIDMPNGLCATCQLCYDIQGECAPPEVKDASTADHSR